MRQAGWANFVRNHDEWSLDKLTEAERQELFKAFGPKPEMQLFGRGLRRRLPTMLNGEQDRMRLVYALNMALPGAPVLFYGEEIGMAENLDIPGRMSVRAPMQWTAGKNGGFSRAEAEDLRRPIVGGRKWGPATINVAAQERDPQSLLKWMEQLIRCRRECPEIAFGTLTVLPVTEAAIAGLRYEWGPCSLIALHNLSSSPLDIDLQLEPLAEGSDVSELLGFGDFKLSKRGNFSARLEGYGWLWIRIRRPGATGQ